MWQQSRRTEKFWNCSSNEVETQIAQIIRERLHCTGMFEKCTNYYFSEKIMVSANFLLPRERLNAWSRVKLSMHGVTLDFSGFFEKRNMYYLQSNLLTSASY